MVLATYNIHRCIGLDGKQCLARIVGILTKINADFIALQEVESHSKNRNNMLDYLAQKTGYIPIAGPTMLSGTADYGNGLLARYPPQKVRLHDISYKNQEPRGAIDAFFQINNKKIRITATHLGIMPNERRHQVKKLLRIMGSPSVGKQSASILMGDINEWFLWGRPLRWIHKHFGNVQAIRTFPSNRPMFALDRIWCHPPELLVRIQPFKTGLSMVASDHLPLKAQIAF